MHKGWLHFLALLVRRSDYNIRNFYKSVHLGNACLCGGYHQFLQPKMVNSTSCPALFQSDVSLRLLLLDVYSAPLYVNQTPIEAYRAPVRYLRTRSGATPVCA